MNRNFLMGFRIFHPFLLVIYTILNSIYLLLTKLNVIQIIPSVRATILLLLGVTTILSISYFITKDWDRSGLITSFLLFVILYYQGLPLLPQKFYIGSISVPRYLLVILFSILIILLINSPILWKRFSPASITKFMNLFSLVLVCISLIFIFSYFLKAQRDPMSKWKPDPSPSKTLIASDKQNLPDIYYIILDGYSRADILQEIYQIDNHEFINFLEEKGFYVADESHSNYIQTTLSLASSLNLDYLDNLGFVNKNSENRLPLRYLIQNSVVRKSLENIGYKTINLSIGSFYSEIDDANYNLVKSLRKIPEIDAVILQNSILSAFVEENIFDIPIPSYRIHRERVNFQFNQSTQIPEISGPKLVFIHILIPHPPFVFTANGEPTNPNRAYAPSDGIYAFNSKEEYIQGYTQQISYANLMMEKTINAILSESNQPPIIILQGDHGGGVGLNWNSSEKTCVRERTSILNAYYLPKNGSKNLYSSITPVNTFRYIFNTYFQTQYPLLEDHSYYSTWIKLYDFENVDEKLNQFCNLQVNWKK